MAKTDVLNAPMPANTSLHLTVEPPKSRLKLTQKPQTATANHWHWTHYHNPYKLGAKLPHFHDYETTNDQPTSNGKSPTLLDLSGYLETELNWFPFENKTKSSHFHRILLQHKWNQFDENPKPNSLPNSLPPEPNATQQKTFDHLAQLSCDSGEMIVRLNFSEPFKGIVYPDHNRLSPCRFFGDGHHNYELRLPLRGCGTRQVSNYKFICILKFDT